MRTAKHFAVGRHDRIWRSRRGGLRTLVRISEPRLADRAPQHVTIRSPYANDRRQGHEPWRKRCAQDVRALIIRPLGDDETAASCRRLSNQLETCERMILTLDDDVLEELAEERFNRALAASLHLEVV